MKKLVIALALVTSFVAFAVDETEVVKEVVRRAAARGWTAEGMAIGLDRLDRWYQANQKNQKFRDELNGGLVEVRIDTNALTKTFCYSNGTEYVEHFRRVEAMGLAERLSAAERKAKVEAARKAAEEAKEKARLERIALLEDPATFALEVALTMKRKDWPEDLARLYLKNELAKLKGPISIHAVVTPQK